MSDLDLNAELMRLASLGFAPMILYDDNGNWCVADEGCGYMRSDDSEDFSFKVFGEARMFARSPEDAWKKYIARLRELGNDV